MPYNSNDNLKSFLSFLKEHSDAVSRDNDSAIEYLKSQGKKPDIFAKGLLKKIKKAQLQTNATNTELTFNSLRSLKELAIQKAKELISMPGFSFIDFMRNEKFALQNRNLENLNSEEIQDILEDYLFLQMKEQNSSENNDQ